MQINLIWAQASNRVIGKDGTMPWHLPEDLAHLKRTTLGCPVIMGRKTWDSIPAKFRPLPGRTNIVLTRQADWNETGAQRASDLREALLFCEQLASKPEVVWVIGGAQIYAQALPMAHKAVVTEIEAEFDGDSFAPQFDASWHETARERHVSRSGLHFSLVTHVRG
jgi:dihydrofolate reductase